MRRLAVVSFFDHTSVHNLVSIEKFLTKRHEDEERALAARWILELRARQAQTLKDYGIAKLLILMIMKRIVLVKVLGMVRLELL